METHILDFVRAFGVRWFVAMSGGLGVPLTVFSYFVAGDIAKFILFLTGVGCAVFSSYWVWAVEHEARLKAEALVYHPFIDIEQSFIFSDPPKYEAWKAKIIPKKSVNNVQVCLEFSADSGGVGYNFRRPKRRLVLMENVNFVLGAEVQIDLIELNNSSDTPFWQWATNMHAGEPLVFTCHRCRLVFIAAQEPPDYLDFIVDFHYEEKLSRDGKTPPRYEKTPSLIGEHRFLYAREWKASASPPNSERKRRRR